MNNLYADINDVELWDLLLKGDMDALETLYRRHYSLLLNYGLKLHPDRELIKDCIQDIFVKLHNSKNYAATSSPQAYLMKSLKNILYNKLLTKREYVTLEHITAFHLSENDTLLEKVFSKNDEELHLSQKLLSVFTKLTENQKHAIYLRYARDLSYKEIAEILSINVQSSMNLVSRAIVKLKDLIQKE
jgi:RNA polymerase sigma-70 factor (ECF subfamily)